MAGLIFSMAFGMDGCMSRLGGDTLCIWYWWVALSSIAFGMNDVVSWRRARCSYNAGG